MREQVEIGRNRSAQRSYVFDDLDIVPSRRTRSSSAVSTAWQLDAYRFDALDTLYDLAAPVRLRETA